MSAALLLGLALSVARAAQAPKKSLVERCLAENEFSDFEEGEATAECGAQTLEDQKGEPALELSVIGRRGQGQVYLPAQLKLKENSGWQEGASEEGEPFRPGSDERREAEYRASLDGMLEDADVTIYSNMRGTEETAGDTAGALGEDLLREALEIFGYKDFDAMAHSMDIAEQEQSKEVATSETAKREYRLMTEDGEYVVKVDVTEDRSDDDNSYKQSDTLYFVLDRQGKPKRLLHSIDRSEKVRHRGVTAEARARFKILMDGYAAKALAEPPKEP